MEMFDLPGKALKYAKEFLLNHYRKSVQTSTRLHEMWPVPYQPNSAPPKNACKGPPNGGL